MNFTASPQFEQGKALLAQPVLPLARLLQLLYLTAPFAKVADILPQLTEAIDTGAVVYSDPVALLSPYLPVLQLIEHIKNSTPLPCAIFNEQQQGLDILEAIDLWIAQQIVTAELEQINSLLCGPCGCTLCCTGPGESMTQLFFEIPLTETETALFDLQRIDTGESRGHKAMDTSAIMVAGRPFYAAGPALIHWQQGWSLILPKESACPNLHRETGACRVYGDRPGVCRKPQIFSYVLEEIQTDAGDTGEVPIPTFTAQKKILAVWDCPYVQELKDEIAAYAQICDLEPVFKRNKS